MANLLARWCREASVDGQVNGGEKVSSQEYERMRRELSKVKTERDILKKALVGSTGQRNASASLSPNTEPSGPRELCVACLVYQLAVSKIGSTGE
ncbi:hypothetical protein ACIQW9_05850 [Herminiimonas sp. NPDC097707]|uniref:hypothetical protein n=1 Tax=Herminiimonas sp. NPDC097707 TaxID=3364007 RepID=UPI00383AE884